MNIPDPDDFDIDDEIERCPECGQRYQNGEESGELCEECIEESEGDSPDDDFLNDPRAYNALDYLDDEG